MSTGTVCEMLLVTLESNQVLFLHHPSERQEPSWLVPHQSGMHPNDTVLQHLVAFLGEVFEPDTSIVHSTSWRYHCQMERLILTYLVVLPHRTWMHRWAAEGRICIEHIGAIEKVQGNNLFPPGRMERDDVLAPEWMDVLDMRLPRPAGLVQFVPSGSLQLQDLTAEGTGLDKLRRSEEAWLSMGG